MGKRKGFDISNMDHKALKDAFVDIDPVHAGLLRIHVSGFTTPTTPAAIT